MLTGTMFGEVTGVMSGHSERALLLVQCFPKGAVPAAILLAAAFCITGLPANGKEADLFFKSNIESILRNNCFSCHSHEARTTEGGLTLDSKSGWQTGGQHGPAIVPGKPKESLLLEAVLYKNLELQMPPEGRLSDSDIAALKTWISQGAYDPRQTKLPTQLDTDWWSLRKLSNHEIPGEGHPIDAFIRQRLKSVGLDLAAKADRTTLARRLYIDLHGMQPTFEEVRKFVDDEGPDAFNKLLDGLLDSPHYGEHWARHWMDVIHFADSHGCEHDVKRENAWRYRDYLIDRLNEDVSWRQFINEQLAPDVFFPEHPHLMAGLGFIAAGPLELSRAGTAPIAFDYLDRDDMVTQTMAAFVSTTANCARCHSHKFDPITQEDYYALQAVFAGIGKGDLEFDSSAEVMYRRREWESLLAATNTRDSDILLKEKYGEVVNRWIAAMNSRSVTWATLEPDVFLSSGETTLTKQDDDSIFASGPVPDQEHYTVTSLVGLKHVTAIRLEVFKDERLPKGGPGRAANGNMHLAEVDVQWFPKGVETAKKLKIAQASADFDQDGWTSTHAIDGDSKTGWAIFPRVNESHQIVFELAAPLDPRERGRLAITLMQRYPPKHVIGRFRLSVTDADAAASVVSSEVKQGLSKSVEQRSKNETLAIAASALKPFAEEQLSLLPPKEKVYAVSSSWSHAKKLPAAQKPKLVHLLKRGEFNKPQEEVAPGALSALDHLPARFTLADPSDEARRRAALAAWLTHPDNPLTWRSIVNRVWQYHFGRGLVDTPNDFGRMGSQPTHPELLDWLAVWFRDEAKGSLKELHRLILTSRTWQQSSLVLESETAVQADEGNRLLWRANRQRLDADVFRDSVLRISGTLDTAMGGPGIEQFVKIQGPQATPSLNYSDFDWNSHGATRRSIYRVVWRGIPDPFMEALDFPDLGLLAPQRGQSISALQSLSLFNNDFVLHFSDQLSGCIESKHHEVTDQVSEAVNAIWLRSPTKIEMLEFSAYAERHGLASFCRLLLNSNEFLHVD